MVAVAAPVKHNFAHSRVDRTLGDDFPDFRSSRDVRTGAQSLPKIFLHGRSCHDRAPGGVVDDLGVDMTARPEYGQAGTPASPLPQRIPHPLAAPLCLCALGLHRYFFLPSLRKIYSSSYLTPLPL